MSLRIIQCAQRIIHTCACKTDTNYPDSRGANPQGTQTSHWPEYTQKIISEYSVIIFAYARSRARADISTYKNIPARAQ